MAFYKDGTLIKVYMPRYIAAIINESRLQSFIGPNSFIKICVLIKELHKNTKEG